MSNPIHLWLRAESKPGEARRALVPADAATLVEDGFSVTVEHSPQSALADQEYQDAGCTMAAEGSWTEAPGDAYILGLKELPDDASALVHRHIYFAHVYKEQRGWQDVLGRFRRGGGELLDLEYLVDDNGRRVAAFGFWAGFCGAALAMFTWCGQKRSQDPPIQAVVPWRNKDAMVADLGVAMRGTGIPQDQWPTVMIIGSAGRVGSGARALAEIMSLSVTPWDLAETAPGGPFREILEHDVFVNCVRVNRPLPPFLTEDLVDDGGDRRLSVISDVSCDPYGDYNPVPLYNQCTTVSQPSIRIRTEPKPLDLIAIDHLPSLLPRESSEDYSAQLLPTLQRLSNPHDPVWRRARDLFKHSCARL
ncbi:MAG: saccharopine dehydrogenase [Xanthomonadales bacterium]|nr:saccharopine dehydrogenase [Xanthomonadales bacterium]